jgi:hypothetical protein
MHCPDHVGDATGKFVFGTPSQVVLDRAYGETEVVDVSVCYGPDVRVATPKQREIDAAALSR